MSAGRTSLTSTTSPTISASRPTSDAKAIAAPPASSTNDLDEEPHEMLEISSEASDDVVKAAARRLSANVHPDSDDPDTEEYVRIQKAKDAMLDD